MGVMIIAGRGNSGGVIRLPAPCSPEVLFDYLADEPYSFLLDSAIEGPKLGRYAFMGSRPFMVFSARGRSVSIAGERGTVRERGDPFDCLRRTLAMYRQERLAAFPPLASGAVGFVGYEAGRLLERLRHPVAREGAMPDLNFALYEAVIAYDLERREVMIVPTGLKGPSGSMARRQEKRSQELLEKVQMAQGAGPEARESFRITSPLKSNFAREGYVQAVGSVKDFIARGEIYQANFTQKFRAERWAGDPYELYLRLRRASPAPFAAYLNFDGVRVLSSSPERFLLVNGTRAETRPIKGTRPRGRDSASDRARALELVTSGKDMAEHMMIVDLERNDLGRVAEAGGVRVREQAALEVYPQVFHLTSTIDCRLRRGLSAVDVLRATFPGGSITGAPKIRAEEILAQLEMAPRGIYTGALGYISFSGDCDLSIVIRTIVLSGRSLSFGVGGGIVADSDPDLEYEESMLKAAGILKALGAETDCDSDGSVRRTRGFRGLPGRAKESI